MRWAVDDLGFSLLDADPRAARRERKLRKRRYGMRVDGASVRLLDQIQVRKNDEARRKMQRVRQP